MQETLSHLRSTREIPESVHIAQLSPIINGYNNMLSHYTFMLAQSAQKGKLRPLNFSLKNEFYF